MKKKYLFVKGAVQWNKLLKKFQKVYNRIKTNNISNIEYTRLSNKLNRIYARLEKMQSNVGLKLAGTSLVLMLSAISMQAQNYTDAGYIKEYFDGTTAVHFGSFISLETIDIDSDGDLDIVFGDYDGEVLLLNNDGSGNFTFNGNISADSNNIDVGYSATSTFADIDNDGDLDMFVGASGGGVQVFLNDGLGNFSGNGLLQADGNNINVGGYTSPTFADIDNDGDLDLFIGVSDGRMYSFSNDGSGNFSANGLMQADGSDIDVGNSSNPIFFDNDNDGNLDLLIGAQDGKIYSFLNDGSGNFSANGLLQADGTDINTVNNSSPNFADIDNDGNIDLLVGSRNGSIFRYIVQSSGEINQTSDLAAEGNLKIDAQIFSDPHFADIDNDGDLDLIVSGAWEGILTFLNDGSDNFISNGKLEADGSIINDYYNYFEFADLDDDGDLDIYLGSYYNGVLIYLNDGAGNFTGNGSLMDNGNIIAEQVYEPIIPEFADLDNDGDLDLYLSRSNGTIEVYTNDGAGNFLANGTFQADGAELIFNGPVSAEFIDFDNDGDLDLFIGEYMGGNILYYENDGVNNFAQMANVQADNTDIQESWSLSLQVIDLDNDGDLDIVTGDYFGHVRLFDMITLPSITAQPTSLANICAGDNANFNVATENVNQYQWQFSNDGGTMFNNLTDDAVYSGSQTANLDIVAAISNAGIYRCMLVNPEDTIYTDTVSLGVDECTIINEVSDNKINIYPNPAHNQLTISNNEIMVDKAEILDLTGKAIKQFSVNTKTVFVDISDLQNGIYFIKIGSQTHKFIKN